MFPQTLYQIEKEKKLNELSNNIRELTNEKLEIEKIKEIKKKKINYVLVVKDLRIVLVFLRMNLLDYFVFMMNNVLKE